jgi:hypothetical protein
MGTFRPGERRSWWGKRKMSRLVGERTVSSGERLGESGGVLRIGSWVTRGIVEDSTINYVSGQGFN